MRYVMMLAFTLAGLTLNGQAWGDVRNGNGTVPSELYSVAQVIFPECPTEDSDWCIWDADRRGNEVGESFISLAGYVIIFD